VPGQSGRLRPDARRTRARTPGAGRRPPGTGAEAPAEGRGRQAPVLRRIDDRSGRPGARRVHFHRRERLGVRAELAPPPDGGVGRRSALTRHLSRIRKKTSGFSFFSRYVNRRCKMGSILWLRGFCTAKSPGKLRNSCGRILSM